MFKKIIEKIKNEKKFRNRFIIIAVFSCFIIFFVFFSNHGLVNRISLEFQKIELEKKISEAKKTQDSLNKQIKLLDSNSKEIEQIAREKYGMIKPGEKVYYVIEKKDNK